jgi:hypothetical protein
MKWPVIVAPFLKVAGMALFPVILISKKRFLHDKVLINHEKIHLKQQAELLVVPFYVLYLLNYLINLALYRRHHTAYMNIVFEREAYANEANIGYINNRKWYNWYHYF